MRVSEMADAGYGARSEEALERCLYTTRAYAPWRSLDPGRSAQVEDRYACLPSTDKGLIRAAFPDGLVPAAKDLADGLRKGEVEYIATSGTTEERVINVWNQNWWDFSERESWNLNSHTARVCTGQHREAILTSAKNVGVLSDLCALSFEERRLGRFLFLNEQSSPVLWDERIIRRMADELDRYRPQVLEANPSYLARFSRALSRLGIQPQQPDVIVLTYENPSLLHLRQVQEVFQAPFLSSYGSTETGYAFMQCEEGSFHLNDSACRADFAQLDGAEAGTGRLRLTPFGNDWVALLRFDPGDIVRLRLSGPCPCGRNGALLLESVEGRGKSLTRDPAGRPVTQGELDRVLAAEGSLSAYQLIQEGPGVYRLRFEVDEPSSRGVEDRLKDLLRHLYGPSATVRVEICPALEPEASGKYLLAKSLIPG
ncbi:MAG: hypothetical protein WBS54_04180 [Acidobacteriota bacterium]